MSAKTTLDSSLANIALEIKERRCNLIGRYRNLQDKIATMERSIPAFMMYNLWMTERQDDRQDTPCDKVREIVNKLSPQPDPADKLLAELRSTVDDLHQETTQLHDKIIDADVKLEETGMELESLELANKEMKERLTELQKEVTRRSTPSLHSIHSDDLICLKKIHQLAEEELKLKNCIKDLENKEITYRRQMNKLLSCKKLQCDGRKIMKIEKSSKGLWYPLKDRKHDARVTKKNDVLKDKGRKTCCSCTSVTLTGFEETSKGFKERKKLCPPPSCCKPLDYRTVKSRAYKVHCKTCQQISTTIFKSKSPYESTNPSYESVYSAISLDLSRSLKRLTKSSVSCNLGKTCNDCEIPAACKQINICRCQEKNIRESSTAPCDCSVTRLDKTHQLMTSRMLYLGTKIENSDSDDEFCECCNCGCEATEN